MQIIKIEILDDCPDLLRDFLFYLETIKGRSEKTVIGYYTDLNVFLRYIKSIKLLGKTNANINIDDMKIADVSTDLICSVTISDIYAYFNYVQSTRKNNAKTRSRKASSIRTFYKYITTKTDYLTVNPAEDLELPTAKPALPKFLSLEESLELLSVVHTADKPQDYCMITLLINCGMRVSELVGINMPDIKFEDKTLKLLGKGNKERIIYINAACVSALEEYIPIREQWLAQHKRQGEKALFISRQYTRISTRRVEQILEKYLKQVGLSGRGYSPHKLRHTAATLMYQYGDVDLMVLKEILGHESLSTTQIYTHVSSSKMAQAAEASPLSQVGVKKKAVKNQIKSDGEK